MSKREYDYWKVMQELSLAGTSFVSVTMVNYKGSAPQEVGAKILVTNESVNSPFWGTIGGGKIENQTVQHAKSLLDEESCRQYDLVQWNLQTDVGMSCGGVVELFFEVHVHNRWELAIFGAGHVTQALVPLLLSLDCHITCLDTRKEWLDRLPESNFLTKICPDVLATQVKGLPKKAFILCMTQGHASDLPVLEQVLKTRNPPFLGAIGSRTKAQKLRKELQEKGVPADVCEQFFCPVGLKIGKNLPGEMAVSIAAQLLQVRDSES